MEKTRIPVPADVLEGLEEIRLSGKTNMFDVPMVERLALEMGFPETALWVHEHRNLYAQGILAGFRSLDDVDSRPSTEDGGEAPCADR